MHERYCILILAATLMFSSCQEDWDNYYSVDSTESADLTVWEMMTENEEYSVFVDLLREYKLDSLLTTDRSVTVFVPSNRAFEGFEPDGQDMDALLRYHILERVLNLQDVSTSRLIETSGKKFALIERDGNSFMIDGEEIVYYSPLCLDGRYYELSEVLYPRPTLYEYISSNSDVFKRYIDRLSMVSLDVNNSVPIGFDDEGNTIYDSVFIRENLFDQEYFPINTEFRRNKATMVVFDQEQYENALDEMAEKLGISIPLTKTSLKSGSLRY
jgi:uncharacterized surface protein with fasciclin (FAS1) repeats